MEFWVFLLAVWLAAEWIIRRRYQQKSDERFSHLVDALNRMEREVNEVKKFAARVTEPKVAPATHQSGVQPAAAPVTPAVHPTAAPVPPPAVPPQPPLRPVPLTPVPPQAQEPPSAPPAQVAPPPPAAPKPPSPSPTPAGAANPHTTPPPIRALAPVHAAGSVAVHAHLPVQEKAPKSKKSLARTGLTSWALSRW